MGCHCLLLIRTKTNLFLIAKFRLKLKKVGKTTRLFKYNLNQFIYILLITSWGFDLDYIELIWRRKWQPTPVLLPGKSHGQRSLVGCSPWGHKESDTTERLHCEGLQDYLLIPFASNALEVQPNKRKNPNEVG